MYIRFLISLLIAFGSKTDKQNTVKNKFIQYVCFTTVDFIHCCGHGHKMNSFCLEKNLSEKSAGSQCNHCIYDS